jgi:hypothetical protein
MPVLATRMLIVPYNSQQYWAGRPIDRLRFIVRVPGLPSRASPGAGATPWAQITFVLQVVLQVKFLNVQVQDLLLILH